MALLSRQTHTAEIIDDQSPTLSGNFVGNWIRGHAPGLGFYNDTCTYTTTPGAFFSYAFSGTQLILYGYPNATAENPTADYIVDGFPLPSQPFQDPSGFVYFFTPKLADGTHVMNLTVTGANDTVPFYFDLLLIAPGAGANNSGTETTRAVPSPTSSVIIAAAQSTPVGAIVGGVVGGIAVIAIMVIAAWYFLSRRSRGGPAYYPEKPARADLLTGEDYLEPFNATAGSPPPSSGRFSIPSPQLGYSDGSSNQLLSPPSRQSVFGSHPSQHNQPRPGEAGLTRVSGTSTQPRTGKAALMSQQFENVQQPVQYQDSGVRFTENVEQGANPSRLPTEVPPTYTSN